MYLGSIDNLEENIDDLEIYLNGLPIESNNITLVNDLELKKKISIINSNFINIIKVIQNM